jgi:uncharacterized protein (DUF2267 family)
MKFTGFEVLDATVQRTNTWLKELMQELNWTDRRKTYIAFRCVLHALRDHLSIKNAVAVGDELPMLIRGMYFEHWDPSGKPMPLRSRDDFISYVSASLERDGHSGRTADMVIRALLRLLDRKATDGEIADLQLTLPPALIELWPPTLRAA